MRTTSSTEKVARALRNLERIQAEPFRPARLLTDAQATEMAEQSAASQTELSKMYGRWLEHRAKTDQGGDS